MLSVDCPLCERPAPFDTERDALDCDACGVAPRDRGRCAGGAPARRLTRAARGNATDPPGPCQSRNTVTDRAGRPIAGATPGGRLPMDFRKYSAELPRLVRVLRDRVPVGPGLRQRQPPRGAEPARRAVRVRARPARGDLRVRPHLRRPLQPRRDGRDGARPADHAHRRGRLHRCPRSSARRRGRARRGRRGQPGCRQGRHHGARRRRHRRRCADHRDVATAVFLAVILAAIKRAPALAALAIPLTLVAIHFGIATLSGASVNPARSIGSAVSAATCQQDLDLHRRRRSSAASSAGWRGA